MSLVMKRLIFVWLLIPIICSCKGGSSDGNYYLPSDNEQECKVELLCELDWAARMYVYRLFPIDSTLIVLGWDLATGTGVHTYTLPGMERRDYLHRGRGDNEMMHFFQSPYIQDNQLYLYWQDKAISMDIDSILLSQKEIISPVLPPSSKWIRYKREIGDKCFEMVSSSPLVGREQFPRFRVKDEFDNVLVENWTWPREDPVWRFNAYSQVILYFSPDCSRYVTAVNPYGGIIETFSFPSLEQIAYNEIFLPEFTTTASTTHTSIKYKNKRYGFTDISTTNSEIWAIWDGATDWSVPDDERPYPTKNTIAVFDWDLNLKRTIKLDYNVYNIAYDEASNVLYVVAANKSGDRYLGRIILDKEYD